MPRRIRIRTNMSWTGNSACRDHDPNLFSEDPATDEIAEQAEAVCRTCPVRRECLAYALDGDERFGIWGGLTRPEREKLVRAAAKAA